MPTSIQPLSTAAVDQLGDRLRITVSEEDLRLLDQYRREFVPDYDAVIAAVRETLGLETSGRPAKSTTAIVDKLKRSSMRLSQMQDIAGCRVVVGDTLGQDAAVERLAQVFKSTVIDRRDRSSHGYRAVHVVLRPAKRPIEVQVRTALQHLWAEFSEKAADAFGIEVKYGGGDQLIRNVLADASGLVANLERLEPNRDELGPRFTEVRRNVENNLRQFLTAMKDQR